jgi:hypothetical protein
LINWPPTSLASCTRPAGSPPRRSCIVLASLTVMINHKTDQAAWQSVLASSSPTVLLINRKPPAPLETIQMTSAPVDRVSHRGSRLGSYPTGHASAGTRRQTAPTAVSRALEAIHDKVDLRVLEAQLRRQSGSSKARRTRSSGCSPWVSPGHAPRPRSALAAKPLKGLALPSRSIRRRGASRA